MSRTENNKLEFTIALITEFADTYRIRQKQAFNYLNRFKGLEFLHKYYDTLHTQSFEDVIDALTMVCRRNGEQLSMENLIEELKYAKGITIQYFFGTLHALTYLKKL